MGGDVEQGAEAASVADGKEDAYAAADFVAPHGFTSCGYFSTFFIVFQ